MPLNVSYMGTKRALASDIADVIRTSQSGPLLDLFSGMCSVAKEVAPSRQIWANDSQHFATTAARAFFKSRSSPINSDSASDLVINCYQDNFDELANLFEEQLELERDALEKNNINSLNIGENKFPFIKKDSKRENEKYKIPKNKSSFPYMLFSITFSGSYFGLFQCISIDSLRYSIDQLLRSKEIDPDEHRWLLLGLCQAASKVANTTGHFAQPLTINKHNKKRIFAQRKRSIWQEWQKSLDSFTPVGPIEWRTKNRVFRSDSIKLLKKLRSSDELPSVIYADPPYTDDQYSRYYHLYETLILYDYPEALGKGRYRPDRFTSDFSLKSKIHSSLDQLITASATLGCRLILSYPTNGLLPESKSTILSLLNKRYGKGEIVHQIPHFHSSLGASKGSQKHLVTEVIFSAGAA